MKYNRLEKPKTGNFGDITVAKKDIAKAIKFKKITIIESINLTTIFFETLGEELVKGNKINVTNLATFYPKFKTSRVGRNPKTGEEKEITSRWRPSAVWSGNCFDLGCPKRQTPASKFLTLWLARVKETKLSKKDLTIFFSAIIAEIKNCLVNGKRIEIRGFGTIKFTSRPARIARNPKTGESVEVTETSYRPHFKPSKALIDAMTQSLTLDQRKAA